MLKEREMQVPVSGDGHMQIMKVQTRASSPKAASEICGFTRETLGESAEPVLHQGARLILVKKGTGKLTLNGHAFEIKTDDLISVVPWDVVQVAADVPLRVQVVSYSFFVLNGIIRTQYNATNLSVPWMEALHRTPVLSCKDADLAAVTEIFGALERECGMDALTGAHAAALSPIFKAAKLVELLVLYCRMTESTDLHVPAGEECRDWSGLFRYISTHLEQKITLSTLSDAFGYSPAEIRRYIYDTVGLTLSDLVNEMRVVRTTDYLIYTDLNQEEISDLLGFVDSSHMSKVFQAWMGSKVTQYRKTYGKVNEICKIKDDRRGVEMVAYIYRHYNDPLQAADVARKFALSVEEMNQHLFYQVEKNFTVLLNTIRVKKACELMLTTDMTTLDIAFEVGYNSIKTFNRQFMRIMGQNPSLFRKSAGSGG